MSALKSPLVAEPECDFARATLDLITDLGIQALQKLTYMFTANYCFGGSRLQCLGFPKRHVWKTLHRLLDHVKGNLPFGTCHGREELLLSSEFGLQGSGQPPWIGFRMHWIGRQALSGTGVSMAQAFFNLDSILVMRITRCRGEAGGRPPPVGGT